MSEDSASRAREVRDMGPNTRQETDWNMEGLCPGSSG